MPKIDWKLKSDGVTLIDNKNEDVLIDDSNIIYKDEFGTHNIDCINKIYKRIGKDDAMTIDFKNNIMTINFDKEELKYDIDTSYIEKDNEIRLTYFIGDEKKEMIITKKEEL